MWRRQLVQCDKSKWLDSTDTWHPNWWGDLTMCAMWDTVGDTADNRSARGQEGSSNNSSPSLFSLQLGNKRLHAEWLSLPLPDNRWYHGLESFLSDNPAALGLPISCRAISLLVPCSLFYRFFSFSMGSDQFRVTWAETCELGVGVCVKLYTTSEKKCDMWQVDSCLSAV